MPSKAKSTFECIECGASHVRWQGQCDQCSQWNSLEPVTIIHALDHKMTVNASPLAHIVEPPTIRFNSGFHELDRVLGDGWVHGSVNLVCGEPGIGKSTLVLQSLLACSLNGQKTLYITAEESAIQIKQRATRLIPEIPEQLFASAITEMEVIIDMIRTEKPAIVVLDSIQMVMSHKIAAMPGSLNQVRLCASMFIKTIKEIGGVGILVGHITKDGQLAGPKMLEHMVDVILFFEGERSMSLRMMRSIKNRFGSTNETGLFRMKNSGLEELTSSQNLVGASDKSPLSGSVITAILSGTRGMLVEMQSLVVHGGYQHVKRTFVGIDSHRAHLMIAILDKFFELKLSVKDVFISLVGGLKTQLPDIDLSICFSMLSSYYLRPLPKQLSILGEVGLTGEVLPIAHLERYISAMELLGIQTCICPSQNKQDWPKNKAVTPVFVDDLFDAFKMFNTLALKQKK
jgi:DNA repair protein RadA/Sms